MAEKLSPEARARIIMQREMLRGLMGPDTIAPKRYQDPYAAMAAARGLRPRREVGGGNQSVAVLPPEEKSDLVPQLIAALGAGGANIMEGIGTNIRRREAKTAMEKMLEELDAIGAEPPAQAAPEAEAEAGPAVVGPQMPPVRLRNLSPDAYGRLSPSSPVSRAETLRPTMPNPLQFQAQGGGGATPGQSMVNTLLPDAIGARQKMKANADRLRGEKRGYTQMDRLKALGIPHDRSVPELGYRRDPAADPFTQREERTWQQRFEDKFNEGLNALRGGS